VQPDFVSARGEPFACHLVGIGIIPAETEDWSCRIPREAFRNDEGHRTIGVARQGPGPDGPSFFIEHEDAKNCRCFRHYRSFVSSSSRSMKSSSNARNVGRMS
jgi:hypothetical protein